MEENEIKCPFCGGELKLPDGWKSGDRVECAFCGRKFAYPLTHSMILRLEEEMGDEAAGVIPEWKIRYAHAECMKDPADAAYFNGAPYGAKMYIGLMFYFAVFAGETTDEQYATCLSEVEEELGAEDLAYLVEHASDQAAADYLGYLLAQRTASAAPSAADAAREAAERAPTERLSPPVRPTRPRRRMRRDGEDAREKRRKIVLGAVAGACLFVVGGAFALLPVRSGPDGLVILEPNEPAPLDAGSAGPAVPPVPPERVAPPPAAADPAPAAAGETPVREASPSALAVTSSAPAVARASAPTNFSAEAVAAFVEESVRLADVVARLRAEVARLRGEEAMLRARIDALGEEAENAAASPAPKDAGAAGAETNRVSRAAPRTFGGVKFGAVLKGAIHAQEAVVPSAAALAGRGLTYGVWGPEMKDPPAGFVSTPIAWVTPRSWRVWKVSFAWDRSVAAKPAVAAECAVRTLTKLRRQWGLPPPGPVPPERARTWIFEVGAVTVTVRLSGATVGLEAEHADWKKTAMDEFARLRRDALAADESRALDSPGFAYVHVKDYGCAFRKGVPRTFCGVNFGGIRTRGNPRDAELGGYRLHAFDYASANVKPFMDFSRGEACVTWTGGALFAVNLYADEIPAVLTAAEYFEKVAETISSHYRVQPTRTTDASGAETCTWRFDNTVVISLAPNGERKFCLRAECLPLGKISLDECEKARKASGSRP